MQPISKKLASDKKPALDKYFDLVIKAQASETPTNQKKSSVGVILSASSVARLTDAGITSADFTVPWDSKIYSIDISY